MTEKQKLLIEFTDHMGDLTGSSVEIKDLGASAYLEIPSGSAYVTFGPPPPPPPKCKDEDGLLGVPCTQDKDHVHKRHVGRYLNMEYSWEYLNE